MSFRRFLKYERPYLLLTGAVFVTTILVFWTDPGTRLHRQTLLYALALAGFVVLAFIVYRYQKVLYAVRHPEPEEAEPLSLEAEAVREALDAAQIAHIRALNEVQAKQKEHYDFIISWFHEIKTPISVLRLMQQTELDPRSVEEEVSRIEHYVDQALYYAKLDSFNQDYELVNCDVEQLAREAVKAYAKTFIARKVKLRLELSPTVVQSDPKWLLFIVNQLLSNSLKYTAEAGEITLSSHETAEEKLLIVRDNGIGIEARDLPRVFNRGFTGAGGRSHAKSTGMGLYLAQELSKKLGHYLTCESEVGRFTEFTMHFPKHHDPYWETVR